MLVKTTDAGSNYFPVPHIWAIQCSFALGCKIVNTVRAIVFIILNALETFGLSGQGTLALPWVNYYKGSLVQLSEKIPVKAPKSGCRCHLLGEPKVPDSSEQGADVTYLVNPKALIPPNRAQMSLTW